MDKFFIKKRKIEEQVDTGREPCNLPGTSSQALQDPITLKVLEYWTEKQWQEKLICS